MTETYTKNISFEHNYFNIKNKDSNQFVFGLFKQSQSGLNTFNNLTSNSNITGTILFDEYYRVVEGVTIDSGDNQVYSGNYDFEMKHRYCNDCIDIGAYEF